jgi:hypothetical protein
MIEPAWFNIGIAILSAVISASFAAGGAWLAVRTEMRWMRRDIDENKIAIEKVEQRRHDGEGVLHDRVTRLNERMTHGGINGPKASAP